MTPISPRAIERVKEAANIGTVIGEYVRLRPAGADALKGLCCFHQEKTPSLFVHPKAGYFHCFGCAVTGDVFNFVQQREGISFPRAAELLADRYGIVLDPGKYDAATERRVRALAVDLAQEVAWYWNQVRAWLLARMTEVVGIERRATEYLAARPDADGPGIEYAWWWLVHAGEIYGIWSGYLEQIDTMKPEELRVGYLPVREGVRGRYLAIQAAEKRMWDAVEAGVRDGQGN